MGHNLHYNEKTQKHSFFSVREKAWHGLGQVISDYPSSSEAIRYAGLDYFIEKRELFTPGDQNGHIRVPDYYATVRCDTQTVLGVVGKDYEVVQNADAFGFFDSIVGGGDGIKYETAGALGKGERIFITAKLPDYIRVGRDDLIEQYIFLTSSHDGSGSILMAFTPIRIVCNNTLNAALRDFTNTVRIRHTASAAEKLKQAHRLMGISNLLAAELETVFNRWARIRLNDQRLKRLIQQAMAPNRETLEKQQQGRDDLLSSQYSNMVSSVLDYALTCPSQLEDTTRGTLFGAYNAVTGYFQNVRHFRDEESRFGSILFGTGRTRSQAAFDLCAEFEKQGDSALSWN